MSATPFKPFMSQAEYAAHRKVQRSYVTKLKQEGRLVLTPEGLVDVAASDSRIVATANPSRDDVVARHAEQRSAPPTPPTPPPLDDADPNDDTRYDYQGSKAKREHFAALEAEASYRAKVKELLEASEVRSVLAETVTVLRTAIEGLPYNLSAVLAATQDETEIRQIITSEVEAALKNASDRLERLGRGEY